ncbi:MAG TPA: response regulator [Burkholderiaceae bacterium]|nr:response regulator [Burkholderiaceae bacterium]
MQEGTGKRVLIVSDDRAEIDTTCRMLHGQDLQVCAVSSVEAVLPTAREFRPDAVLLDVKVEGQSTTYLARALRKEPMFVGSILIAVTTDEDDECRRRLAGAGFDHMLTRPLAAADLLAAITSR